FVNIGRYERGRPVRHGGVAHWTFLPLMISAAVGASSCVAPRPACLRCGVWVGSAELTESPAVAQLAPKILAGAWPPDTGRCVKLNVTGPPRSGPMALSARSRCL